MELYSSTTRFALAANNSEKIIEPIQSRCAVLRYTRLTDAQIMAKVRVVVYVYMYHIFVLRTIQKKGKVLFVLIIERVLPNLIIKWT